MSPWRIQRASLAVLALGALLAWPAHAGSPRPDSPVTLALEGGFLQTDGDRTSGINTGLVLGLKFTDQLSITGMGTYAASRAGPISTLGFGLSALLDSTPLAPFFDLQAVLLGPQDAAGYSLAMRLGLGADWKIAPAFAVGLVVRTLTPLDSLSATRVAGTEVALRVVFTPGASK